MKARILLLISALFLIVFSACKKDPERLLRNGTYTGTFTVTYGNNQRQSGPVTLVLDNGRFNCTGNANFIPAGGTGAFSHTANTLSFRDEGVWTANFDWNLILNGEYAYTFDGQTLRLSADKNDVGHYRYELQLR